MPSEANDLEVVRDHFNRRPETRDKPRVKSVQKSPESVFYQNNEYKKRLAKTVF